MVSFALFLHVPFLFHFIPSNTSPMNLKLIYCIFLYFIQTRARYSNDALCYAVFFYFFFNFIFFFLSFFFSFHDEVFEEEKKHIDIITLILCFCQQGTYTNTLKKLDVSICRRNSSFFMNSFCDDLPHTIFCRIFL